MGGQMPSTTVARGRGAGLGKETPVHIRVDGGLWYTEADTQTDAHLDLTLAPGPTHA